MKPRRVRLHPDVVAAAIVLVSAAMVGALGLADVPVGWIIAGTVGLTIAAYALGYAARSDVSDGTRVMLLVAATGALVLIIVGIAAYVRWWDPSDQGVATWAFVLKDASETECVRVSGEPGGEPLQLAPNVDAELAPVCGGSAHLFECRDEDDVGQSWLRLAGSQYWLPALALRPRTGLATEDLPSC